MLQLLNLPALLVLGNLDTISTSPSNLTVICSVCGCCLRSTGKSGSSWETLSRKCFRIQRDVWPDSGYMSKRRSVEVIFGRILHLLREGGLGSRFRLPRRSRCHLLPKELDEKVAKLHFPARGAARSVLTQEQADYIGVKGGHYRY